MATEKKLPKRKADPKRTKLKEKLEESEQIGTFEDLLDMDPSKVVSIKVEKQRVN